MVGGHHGILAAIAIPAYQDYIMRAKVTELFNQAAMCKVSVSEFYQAKAMMPPTTADAGCASSQTVNAKAPVITGGLIEIQSDGGLQVAAPRSGNRHVAGVHPDVRHPPYPRVRRLADHAVGLQAQHHHLRALPADGLP
jgi:type II secretory pathway pseudopilin PulG